jgi:hypothetical protein
MNSYVCQEGVTRIHIHIHRLNSHADGGPRSNVGSSFVGSVRDILVSGWNRLFNTVGPIQSYQYPLASSRFWRRKIANGVQEKESVAFRFANSMMQPHPSIGVSVSAIRVPEACMNPRLDNSEISCTILIRCSIRISMTTS